VVAVTEKLSEVRRILDRYIVEVVEHYDLCPWARPARLAGEVGIEVLWGEPAPAVWIAAAHSALGQPGARIAMVVAPESAMTPGELRSVRGDVTTGVPGTGVAHFHPEAEADLASPARLVPFLRRSPDPLLQIVPLALLESIRGTNVVPDALLQAQMLGGTAPAMRGDVADMIAEANHTRVSAELAAVTATLDAIAADRRESYSRAGIRSSR